MGSQELSNIDPKRADETHEHYCKRAEESIATYFTRRPNDVEAKKGAEIHNYYVTCSIDKEIFQNVLTKTSEQLLIFQNSFVQGCGI
jgi:hypothetical protein